MRLASQTEDQLMSGSDMGGGLSPRRGLTAKEAVAPAHEEMENELQKKLNIVVSKLLLDQADQMFQADEFTKIWNVIMDRVLTDDDKQYKLDVEDIIEEQLYQCV